MNCLNRLVECAAVIGLLQAEAASAVTFSDSTFDLSSYTINTFTENQLVTVLHLSAGGNPGAAVDTLMIGDAGESYSGTYFLGNSFLYDPAAEGAISTISFSQDVLVASTLDIGGLGQNPIIYQNGNYYGHFTAVQPEANVWQTASATALRSTDFSLITNLAVGTSDSTQHPDFSAGRIQFGFREGWNIGSTFAPVNETSLVADNYVLTLSPVPEASTSALMLLGMLGLVSRRLRSSRRQEP